ncbi:MAG: tetratricopeptide repeat protein [Planctomycetota bacterium]
MFADLFLPNLLLFAAGQSAAWYYLRTGRFFVGASATAALWLLADWFVLAKFVFGASPADQQLPLWLLQVVAVGTVAALVFGLWRRKWSAVARQRPALFQAGIEQYLLSDYGAAKATLRRLVRTDPWDAAAWIALGNVFARLTRPARARTCYRRALAVDMKRAYADLVAQQTGLLQSRRATAAPSYVESRVPAAAPQVVHDSSS